MKKILAVILLTATLFVRAAATDVFTGDTVDYDAAQTVARITELNCASAVLCDLDSGKILAELQPDVKRAPASVTKIMTMLLVLEACHSGAISLDDTVTAGEHACSMGGSQVFLEPGEQMSVLELFKCVSIASANDAAVALAEHVAGSEELFVEKMNSRARELGMVNTEFKNACGLDSEGHLTTARDIAIMTVALARHSEAFTFTTTWMDSVRNGEFILNNTNKLIRSYKGITGMKTGSTSEAGFCISATAEKNGMRLCAVVLGAETSAERFQCATALLNLGFASFESADPTEGLVLPDIRVKGGKNETLSLVTGEHSHIIVERGRADELMITAEYPQTVDAPVKMGDEIGKVTVSSKGEVISRIPILAGEDVEKLGFFGAFGRLLSSVKLF